MKTSLHRIGALLSFTALLTTGASAQYTTPNTGETYRLGDLVELSDGVFTATSDTSFLQVDEFTLAEDDTLLIDEDITWLMADSVRFVIEGTFLAEPPTQAVITAVDEALRNKGMRFEESAYVHLQRMAITHGGGLKCLTPDLILQHCLIADHAQGAVTSAALELSRGKVIIDHVEFRDSERAAISSPTNGSVAPRITNCLFYHNGFGNTNRPQINLGPSGEDTTLIRNNTIIGNRDYTRVGGISFSLLTGGLGHVVIDSNTVVDNRYGIAVTGSNVTSIIADNIITDNDTEVNPMAGGSGINLNGGETNVAMVYRNEISGSLWGVSLQGTPMPNFGDTAAATFNPGQNSFANNGNGGVIYALYNNTPSPVPAMNNCWDFENIMTDSSQVASVIVDMADNPSHGEVFFMPFWDCGAIGTNVAEVTASPFTIHPNPSNGPITVVSRIGVLAYEVYGPNGQLVRSAERPTTDRWTLDGLGTGLYLLRATTTDGMVHTERFVIN